MTSRLKRGRRMAPVFGSVSGPLRDYIAGLRRKPRSLPCKLFYDDVGNALFKRICELEEYYPTRAEKGILQANIAEISQLAGVKAAVVELGSGSPAKARLLLDHLDSPAAYIPVEISREQLAESCDELRRQFPALKLIPVCTDYTRDLGLPPIPSEAESVMFFFPGSTVGNFEPIEAVTFLLRLANLGGKGAGLLVGIDLKKDPALLEAAYNDREGVTAEFNLNILARANNELAADFRLDRFRHRAFYQATHGRVVMQLESIAAQKVRIGPETFSFESAERITTEYSYKYNVGEFRALARLAGFAPKAVWTDPGQMFSIHYLTAV